MFAGPFATYPPIATLDGFCRFEYCKRLTGHLQKGVEMRANFHESLAREHEVKSSSDRGFGLVMAAACSLISGC